MENLIKEISAAGVVPVVKLDNAANAVKLAEALRKGGLNCAEITFRTDAAEESIKLIAEKYPDMLIRRLAVHNRSHRVYNKPARQIICRGYFCPPRRLLAPLLLHNFVTGKA